MRALLAALTLVLTACAAPLAPPALYPEAELAPGHILAPIRAAMGNSIVFTNATVIRDDAMELEGYRADGAYRFLMVRQDDIWLLASTTRVGPAPPSH